MRGERGITLVALVVTIIVLLILAGITITYVLADNGIFGQAEKAAKETEMATIRDYVAGAQAELMIEKYAPTEGATAASIMAGNFPAKGYFVDTTALTAANGKFSGSVEVKVGKTEDTANTYNVTFDENGVATVTAPDAE